MVIKLTAGEAHKVRLILHWIYRDAGSEAGIPGWKVENPENWNAVSRNVKEVAELLGMEIGE